MKKQPDKIGVFVAGGPAPGINGVIKGIVQEADNAGLDVLGYLDGARGLVQSQFVHLTRRMVENIHILGGSVIGTSRYKMDKEGRDLDAILTNLRREGIDGLVSIGGEGTLQLADHLRRAGVRVVHVPKTIDNDIAGVDQTFGFDTAVHEASRLLTAVKLDAQSGSSWFVVEIMGRLTGHLALEAGLASGCTRVLIPEDGEANLEELLALMACRAECGQNWGVILVSESVHFGAGLIQREGRLGGVGEELAERLKALVKERGLPCSVRTSNLGYFLRCAEPTGFDRSYAAKLGLGAGKFILDPERSGQMVTIQNDHLVGVPMETVAGKVKYVDCTGIRYNALQATEGYETTRISAAEKQRLLSTSHRAVDWLDAHCDPNTLGKLAMRLGIPIETLLETLDEMIRVETGEALAEGCGALPTAL